MRAADAPVADDSAGDSASNELLAASKGKLPDQTELEVVRDIEGADRLLQPAVEVIERGGELGRPVAVGVREQL